MKNLSKNTLGNSESEDISSSVSVDQLIERASLPLHDYKMGRIKTQEEVEQLSKDWWDEGTLDRICHFHVISNSLLL